MEYDRADDVVLLSALSITGTNLEDPEQAQKIVKTWDERHNMEIFCDSGVDDQVSPESRFPPFPSESLLIHRPGTLADDHPHPLHPLLTPPLPLAPPATRDKLLPSHPNTHVYQSPPATIFQRYRGRSDARTRSQFVSES